MPSRWLFAAGAWVLIALGLAHLFGHYSLVTTEPADETHRRLLDLMRGYQFDHGHNFLRSTMEILAGFSLAFSVLSLALGLLDLVVLRHSRAWPSLLREVATVNAGALGILTALALRYWFPVPFLFLAAAFLCFVTALGVSPRRG
jgi:hypothetical protein